MNHYYTTKILDYIFEKQKERVDRRAKIIEKVLEENRIPREGDWMERKLKRKLVIVRHSDDTEEIEYDGISLWRGIV